MTPFRPGRSTLLACGISIALGGCVFSDQEQQSAPAVDVPATGAARIAGSVRDSLNAPIANARLHVYRGNNDSIQDTVIASDSAGRFLCDLRPGKIRIFAEKDGKTGKSIDFSGLEAGKTSRIDSLRLSRILTGSFTLPGVKGSSFSVRVEGSPLEATISTSGNVTVSVVNGQESILILAFTSGNGNTQTYKFRIFATNGVLRIEPVGSDDAPTTPPAPPQSGIDSLVIRPTPEDVQDAGVIGGFSGGSGRWQNTNFGNRLEEGIGGAYDGNTIGRLLWKYSFPDSLKNRRILSAKLVFTTLYWGIRPQGGQDLTIEGFRLLKPWKEGRGPGQEGLVVSTDNDGASASGPSYGKIWNKPLVGLDGIDAESLSVVRGTLAYKSMEKFALDITDAVKGWVANPTSNNGLVFRSTHESDGLYLDYPAFASDDYADAGKRPYLVLELAPPTSDPGIKIATIQPGPDGQDDACVIGTFSGTGSHDGNTQGSDPLQSLGGSWDYNTVGRLLWKIALPDSLRSKTILSARAVFKVNKWLARPLGGHDYKIEAHKMLRSWNEGTGAFPGEANNSALNGASSLGPRFGETWNTTLVGFDGVDAERARSSYAALPWNDTTSLSFDFTNLVDFWLANPEKNHGVVFRSLEELDPSFPNFPGFDMSEAENPLRRPKLVIEYK